MDRDEEQMESWLQDKDVMGPRITPWQIDAAIINEAYYLFPGTTMTICCLTLRNGFNVIGYNSPASQEKFDEEVGRDIARRNARKKIWELEGYLLRERISS